jgi:hypothetical protein
MLDALCDHLAEKPGLYIEEMAIFLWDEFNILPSSSSIKRALSRAGWTKRKPNRKPKNRTHNYEISTNISYPNFGHIILCSSMSLDVIKGLDIGELAGHHLA